MNAVRILRGCGASGASLQAGKVYVVPAEVSANDAALLVRLGKAEVTDGHAAPDRHKSKEAKRDVL